MTPAFTQPTEDDLNLIGDRWAAIESLADEELGIAIDESMDTLDILQQILDGDLVNHDGLLALGSAFGRIMAHNIEGLDWWIAIHESNREICLRYEETTFYINPITLISKRIGRNEPVMLTDLFQAVVGEVERASGSGPI